MKLYSTGYFLVASFTQYKHFELQPRCITYQQFVLFIDG